MSFAIYENYQDSDFSWLGKIPAHWSLKRVGHHVDFITGFAFKSDFFSFDSGIKLVRGDNVTEGYLRWGEKTRYWSDITKDIERYLLEENDILIGMDGSKVGKNFAVVKSSDLPLLLVQRVARLRVDEKLSHRFLSHLIGSELFKTWVALVKTDPAIPHISPADIRGFPLPYPCLEEQVNIANFLDHETAKIDTLIEKQQQLIKLLKEKRQAVISHAVTKGLPSVNGEAQAPMKDSGVEWLGEVPEHWNVLPIKYLSHSVGTGGTPKEESSFSENGGICWFTPGDFKGDLILPSSKKHVTENSIKIGDAKSYPKNSVLVIGIGATLGKVALSESEFSCNQQINVIHPNDKVNARFLTLSMSTQVEQMKLQSNSSTIGIMNQEKTKQIIVAVPPFDQQKIIVDYLSRELLRFDVLLEKANSQIYLLQERRTALISAAVTGKIDVRNWQAPTSQVQALEQTA